MIAEIRTSIFELEARPASRPNLSAAFLNLVDQVLAESGVEPSVVIDGPLSDVVTPELGDDLLATTRELLTNVVRHSRATRVDIRVDVGAQTIALEVHDDGCGFAAGGEGAGHGLVNARARAETWGGDTVAENAAGGGACITWRVPRP